MQFSKFTIPNLNSIFFQFCEKSLLTLKKAQMTRKRAKTTEVQARKVDFLSRQRHRHQRIVSRLTLVTKLGAVLSLLVHTTLHFTFSVMTTVSTPLLTMSDLKTYKIQLLYFQFDFKMLILLLYYLFFIFHLYCIAFEIGY